MNGWYTKHEEFTLAKGDPATIKLLISEFKLEEIVSFDETDQIITTTIQHNRHIRLSDLLFSYQQKVIVFTLPQYLEIIKQLFLLQQQMQRWQIQHGNLTTENVLLDLGDGNNKLYNKPNLQISFQLKLINFAIFSNQPISDDYHQIHQIYQEIFKKFPYIQFDFNNNFNINDLEQEIQRIKSQNSLIYPITNWNPQVVQEFEQSYKQIKINNIKCMDIIKNLHLYHLINHHYNYLQNNEFDYLNEPGNIKQAYEYINYLTTIEQEIEELQQLTITNELVNKEEGKTFLYKIKTKILSNIVIYLKQQGYFQNIFQFIQINNDLGQANIFREKLIKQSLDIAIDEIIYNQNLRGDFKLPSDIQIIYTKSINNFKTMVQTQVLNHLKQFKSYDCIQIICNQMIQELQQQLNKIKEIGEQYLLISIHGQKAYHSFNQLIVDSWLKWIDQYIFDNQFMRLEQLNKINLDIFMEFLQKKNPFSQYRKKQLDNFYFQLFNQYFENPLLNQEIQYIKTVLETKYQYNFKFVKDILCDEIITLFYQSFDSNFDQNAQVNIFNQHMEHLVFFHFQMINEKYKREIKIANDVYNENWQKILSKCKWQQFKYCNRKLQALEDVNKIKYLNSIKLDPSQSSDQFKNYCFQEFNKIFNDQCLQTLNFEALNYQTQNALNHASSKYQSLLHIISQQYQNDVASINWDQIEKTVFERFFTGWEAGMEYRQLDELLNIQVQEQQIHLQIRFNQALRDFIELSSQEGHYYLFDEEYQQIQQILHQIQYPFKVSHEQYHQILNTLKIDQYIQLTKTLLTEQIKALIPKELTQNNYFYRKSIELLFKYARCQANGKYSLWQAKQPSSSNLIKKLLEYFPKDHNQTQQLLTPIQEEYASQLALTRQKIETHIISKQEYLQVIDERDRLFLQIVHPSQTQNLDQDQIAYLEKQIDKFQKAKFHQWLDQRWEKYKDETQKHQNIDEEEWERMYQTLRSEMEKSISNKLDQLEIGKTLVDTFRNKWINIWSPKVVMAFIDLCEE